MHWQVGLYVAAVLLPLAAFLVQILGIRWLGRLNAYIATGAIEVGPISTGSSVAGLCVKGEPTAGTPGLSLVKTANPTTYSSVGDVIAYTYEITNSGQTTLGGPFSVSDDKQGSISP